jgi:hypothetical protein
MHLPGGASVRRHARLIPLRAKSPKRGGAPGLGAYG